MTPPSIEILGKQRVVVLGGGMSGVGAAILAVKHGHEVFLSDGGRLKDAFAKALQQHQIPYETEGHDLDHILNADLVVKSPGIPDTASIIQKIHAAGIDVISEIEYAARYCEDVIVAITGSNGKTTVTSLVGHLVQSAHLDATVGGNIGQSFAGQVAEGPAEYRILEVSSFQLDGIKDFKPHIAVLLNITPDHLDRYQYNFDNYAASKLRITMNQDHNDYLVYNADDPAIEQLLKTTKIKAQLVPFSTEKELDNGAFVKDNTLNINLNTNTFKMPLDQLAIKGKHNAANAMAAATTAKLLQIRKDTIRQSLESFQGVEHRLENVLQINKVQYINDSKATNINATYFALDSMERPTVWIVGGVDKGNDYSELFKLVHKNVKAIVCLGVDNSKIVDAFGNVVEHMVQTTSMQDAVKVAYKLASPGDNVLLSPACASFDLFENYEDRGLQFKQAVRSL
jgi:UDP-N-acetylmuramoylalanine--D-glutamate ligase